MIEVVKFASLVRVRARTRFRVWLWRRRNPALAKIADAIHFDIEREFFRG